MWILKKLNVNWLCCLSVECLGKHEITFGASKSTNQTHTNSTIRNVGDFFYFQLLMVEKI